MDFNINETVRVKLTDYGRQLHAADHAKFWNGVRGNHPYRAPKEDADGWSEWQLWTLMNEFGPHVSLGSRVPFETTIQIIEKRASAASGSDSEEHSTE